jgi:hypothetical protein
MQLIFDYSSSSYHQSMDNKIINSSEYFILDLPVMLYRNIGCPKKNIWGFEIKCFKMEDKVIQEIKITNFQVHTMHLDNYRNHEFSRAYRAS